MIILFIYILILIINTKICNKITKTKIKNNQKQNIVHFIKCGHGDSILVEGKGHFGLIDSSNPIKGKNKFKNKNVFSVLKYLQKLKVQKLDFIIGTHSHSDHIGGIKEIAYEYVDNSTIYYYKKLNINLNLDKYINYKDYLNVMDSIKKKNATLVDVTNKEIKFNANKFILDENQNSIITLIKYKNIKIVLPGDKTNDYKLLSNFGDINILKFPHHGFGDISINNLRKLKPAHIIISSDYIYPKTFNLIKYYNIFNNFAYKLNLIIFNNG
jgi:competence protein ComEC